VSELLDQAVAWRQLAPGEGEATIRKVTEFIVDSGLPNAQLPEKRRMAERLLRAAGFFEPEAPKNLLAVAMRLFSVQLAAQARMDGVVTMGQIKYEADAAILYHIREQTRGRIAQMANERLQLLLDQFSVLSASRVELARMSAMQKRAQVQAMVQNISQWSTELADAVRVRPYLAAATQVAIRCSGYDDDKNMAKWLHILGREAMIQAQKEQIIPLLQQGRFQDASRIIIDCQKILREVLEANRDIYPQIEPQAAS
jgi:hypothetical protein